MTDARSLQIFVEDFIRDFETDFVLNGRIVDNPDKLWSPLVDLYKAAKDAMESVGGIIIRLGDKYFFWGKNVDAPLSYALDEPFVKRYLENDPNRWQRLQSKGTTSFHHQSAEETVECNRAGPRERKLTADEIYKMYASEEAYETWMKVEGETNGTKKQSTADAEDHGRDTE